MLSFKGQAVVEAILVFPLIFLGMGTFLVLTACALSSMIAHHCLYEMLICEQLVPKPPACEDQARRELSLSLVFGTLASLEFHQSLQSASAQADIALPLRLHVHPQESIELPLHEE